MKDIDQKNYPLTKKDPLWASFNVKLLNGLFSSCFLKHSGTQSFVLLSFFFFISNITTICQYKIPPFSDSEMISKKVESSRLISFSVNLTYIFYSYRQILSENDLLISSKIVTYRLVGTHYHVHNVLRPSDVWPKFPLIWIFLCSVLFQVKTRFCLKYFVNAWSLKVNRWRSLWIKSFIYKSLDSLYFYIYTEKIREVQYRSMKGYV